MVLHEALLNKQREYVSNNRNKMKELAKADPEKSEGILLS